MALDFFTKTSRCLVCGGWRWAGDSAAQCTGGVDTADRTVLYCSIEPNDYPSASGKTWRYRLDRPYVFQPEPSRQHDEDESDRRRTPSRGRGRPTTYSTWPRDVPESWNCTGVYFYDYWDPKDGPRDTTAEKGYFRVARYEGEEPDGSGRGKSFRPFYYDHMNRHRWGYPGSANGLDHLLRRPYKLLELLNAIDRGLPIYVVEGEKDVESGYAHTDSAAFTCNPGGARAWLPKYEYSRWFEGASRVFVVADRDESGRQWAKEVREDLASTVQSIQIVQSLVDTPGADLSDHLEAGHILDELEPVEL